MTPVDPRELLSESREEVSRADGKASMLLSALTVAAGVVAAALLAGSWSPNRLEQPFRALWWISLVFVAAGSVTLGLAVWPRLRHHLDGASASYFDEIALLGDVASVKAALEKTDASARTLTQLVAISKIARRKYKLIRWAMALLAIALVLILLAVIAGR